MSAHGEKNYTRSLRDEIKAKQEELKALKARSKEERDAKKSTRDETKTSRSRLSAQAKFLLEEAPAQVDTATQLLDGLFGKRELVEEFKAYFDLRQERLAALKAAGKKKSKEKTETPPAAE